MAETPDVDLPDAAFDHGNLDGPVAHVLSRDIGAGQDVATLSIEGSDASGQTVDLGKSQLLSFARGKERLDLVLGEDAHPGDDEAVDANSSGVVGADRRLRQAGGRYGEKAQQDQGRNYKASS